MSTDFPAWDMRTGQLEKQKITRAPAMSFIVRIWNDDGSTPPLRGEIEHVRTGERRLFLDYDSLTSLIDGWRGDLSHIESAV